MQNCNPSLLRRILQTFRLYAHTRFRMLKSTVAVVELYEKARIIRQGFWVKIRISLIRSVRNLFTLSTKQQSIGIGNSSLYCSQYLGIWVTFDWIRKHMSISNFIRAPCNSKKKSLKTFHNTTWTTYRWFWLSYTRSRFILSNKQPHARCTNVRYMST